MTTYREAGVNIDLADQMLSNLGKGFKSTHHAGIKADLSGFAALVDRGDHYLVSCTDGIGTKVILGHDLGIYHTLGQDLVGMVINDMLMCGAKPLFFLDYLGTGKLQPSIHQEVLNGLINTCQKFNIPLIGGETAEMPGLYHGNHFELVGFAIGEVKKSKLIDGSQIKVGDQIWGLPSSGFHSNGYSLLRKLFKDKSDLVELLNPTKIYQNEILDIIAHFPELILGMAHITGGGFQNIVRINQGFGYQITPPSLKNLPSIFQKVKNISGLSNHELYRTFNMGVGVVMVSRDDDFSKKLSQLEIEHFHLGEVTDSKTPLDIQF